MSDADGRQRPSLVMRGAGLLESVAMVLMVGLVLSIFYSVVAREVFKLSVPWAEEVAAGLLAWSVMLGAAAAWGQRRHIVIDVLLRRIALGARVWISVLIECGALLLFYVIARGAYLMMFASANNTTTALGISFTWLYLALLIGTVAMILFSLAYLVSLIRNGKAVIGQTETKSEWTTS